MIFPSNEFEAKNFTTPQLERYMGQAMQHFTNVDIAMRMQSNPSENTVKCHKAWKSVIDDMKETLEIRAEAENGTAD